MLFVSPAALNFSSLKHSHSWRLHNKDVLQSVFPFISKTNRIKGEEHTAGRSTD